MKIWLYVILLISSITSYSSPLPTIYVKINRESTVTDMVVKIKDIACLTGGSTRILQEIGNTVIATSPLPGRTIMINRYNIKKQISEKYGAAVVSGAARVRIGIKHHTYTSTQYIDYAKFFILQSLNRNFINVRLTPIGLYRDIELPLGSISFRMSSDGPRMIQGRAQISISIFVNNIFYTMQPIWFKVDGKQQVYIAKTDIKQFQNIESDMVKTRFVEIADLLSNSIQCRSKFGNFISIKNIKLGSIITKNNAQAHKWVIKGQDVHVLAQSGNIKISLVATALQNGIKGDLIKLKNKISNKEFLGEVIGMDSVRSF